jgi:transposase-like protein
MSKIQKTFDESVKRYVVERLERGEVSLSDVAREVGATKSSVWKWSKEYGRFRVKPQVVEVVMSNKQEEIDELKKALADAHLKNVFYEELLAHHSANPQARRLESPSALPSGRGDEKCLL